VVGGQGRGGVEVLAKSAKELDVYQMAYEFSMELFRLSRMWPKEEQYSLTDQIRRSSRSVCANLREAWAKRRYKAHFTSKLTDCDGENSETDTWLDYARDCGYLSQEVYQRLSDTCRSIGGMLGSMIHNASTFLIN